MGNQSSVNVLIDLRINALTRKHIQLTHPHIKRLTHLHINAVFYVSHVKKLPKPSLIEKKVVFLQIKKYVKYKWQVTAFRVTNPLLANLYGSRKDMIL